jgi:uncharacterized protein YcfJ
MRNRARAHWSHAEPLALGAPGPQRGKESAMDKISQSTATRRAVQAMGVAAALLAGNAMATEYGTVVSKTAVYNQVSVPVQQCVQQDQVSRAPASGAGALIGALIGGGAGNLIGHGSGRALATGAGVLAGAITGNNVEANAEPSMVTPVQQCHVVQRLENHLVGYDVVYDYNGQRYSTRLASDPGDHVPLNVSVTPAAAPMQAMPMAYTPATVVQPVVVESAPVVVQRPWVAPIGLSVDAGWGGGWGGHHWR